MTYGRGLLCLGVIIASPDCQESGSMLLRAQVFCFSDVSVSLYLLKVAGGLSTVFLFESSTWVTGLTSQMQSTPLLLLRVAQCCFG